MTTLLQTFSTPISPECTEAHMTGYAFMKVNKTSATSWKGLCSMHHSLSKKTYNFHLTIHVTIYSVQGIVAYQAPPSMGLSRQKYWSGCHRLLESDKRNPLPHINKPLELGSSELQCKRAGPHGLKDITFPASWQTWMAIRIVKRKWALTNHSDIPTPYKSAERLADDHERGEESAQSSRPRLPCSIRPSFFSIRLCPCSCPDKKTEEYKREEIKSICILSSLAPLFVFSSLMFKIHRIFLFRGSSEEPKLSDSKFEALKFQNSNYSKDVAH